MKITSLKFRSIFDEPEIKNKIEKVLVGTGGISFNIKNVSPEFITNNIAMFKIINEIAQKHNVIIQIYDFDHILCDEHLYHAVYFAYISILTKTNISNNQGLEYLLYASQQRQINVALDTMGFKFNPNIDEQKFVFTITGTNKAEIENSEKEMIGFFKGTEFQQELNEPEIVKMKSIMKFFDISEFEVQNSLMSQDFKEDTKLESLDKEQLISAIINCLIERMTLLSMEILQK